MAKRAKATEPKEYQRKKTGRMIPCDGEAHSNPYIDNCGKCAPRWGEVEELAPVDLAEAKTAGLDVAMPDVTREQCAELLEMEKRGEGRLVSVTRKMSYGSRSYYVFRWAATPLAATVPQ